MTKRLKCVSLSVYNVFFIQSADFGTLHISGVTLMIINGTISRRNNWRLQESWGGIKYPGMKSMNIKAGTNCLIMLRRQHVNLGSIRSSGTMRKMARVGKVGRKNGVILLPRRRGACMSWDGTNTPGVEEAIRVDLNNELNTDIG